MDLDAIRAYCLSFRGVTESLQWGDELCFKIHGKLFTIVGLGSVPVRVTFKCNPEGFAELTEREGISAAAYVGRYKWVTLETPEALSDAELRDGIANSYQMVVAKVKPGRKLAGRRKRRKTRAA